MKFWPKTFLNLHWLLLLERIGWQLMEKFQWQFQNNNINNINIHNNNNHLYNQQKNQKVFSLFFFSNFFLKKKKTNKQKDTALRKRKRLPTETEIDPSRVLSEELELYLAKVTAALKSNDQKIISIVLQRVSKDTGFESAVPFFVHFIVSEVWRETKTKKKWKLEINFQPYELDFT